MLVFIAIAIIAMVMFIIFFTGKSADLFSQFGQVSPSENQTARDVCQIACNNAKLRNDCEGWCAEKASTGEYCYELIDCDIDCYCD